MKETPRPQQYGRAARAPKGQEGANPTLWPEKEVRDLLLSGEFGFTFI